MVKKNKSAVAPVKFSNRAGNNLVYRFYDNTVTFSRLVTNFEIVIIDEREFDKGNISKTELIKYLTTNKDTLEALQNLANKMNDFLGSKKMNAIHFESYDLCWEYMAADFSEAITAIKESFTKVNFTNAKGNILVFNTLTSSFSFSSEPTKDEVAITGSIKKKMDRQDKIKLNKSNVTKRIKNDEDTVIAMRELAQAFKDMPAEQGNTAEALKNQAQRLEVCILQY